MLVEVIGQTAEGVRPHVCIVVDVERHYLDVVGFDQEKELMLLAHHGRGLGGEMREHPNYRLVAIVNQ